jgi:hypothetical protein
VCVCLYLCEYASVCCMSCRLCVFMCGFVLHLFVFGTVCAVVLEKYLCAHDCICVCARALLCLCLRPALPLLLRAVGQALFQLAPGAGAPKAAAVAAAAPVAQAPAAAKAAAPAAPAAAAPAAAAPAPKAAAPAKAAPIAPLFVPTGLRTEKRVAISRMRKRIAERLKEAQNVNAMLTTFQEVCLFRVVCVFVCVCSCVCSCVRMCVFVWVCVCACLFCMYSRGVRTWRITGPRAVRHEQRD